MNPKRSKKYSKKVVKYEGEVNLLFLQDGQLSIWISKEDCDTDIRLDYDFKTKRTQFFTFK